MPAAPAAVDFEINFVPKRKEEDENDLERLGKGLKVSARVKQQHSLLTLNTLYRTTLA